MLTPPDGFSDQVLTEVVERAWGIEVVSLEYRPLGFGSHHWLAADHLGGRYFVTVDELGSDSRTGDEVSGLGLHLRQAFAAATDLRDFGCSFVVAPIPTKADEPLVSLPGHAVALYPFVEGKGFSSVESFAEAQRDQVLAVVVELHMVPLTAIRAPAVDEFVVPWLDQLDPPGRSVHDTTKSGSVGPYADVASDLLVDNEAEIRRLRARYRTLVAQHMRDPAPFVVTHGEIHPGNVMLTSKGWVIVDWDTVLVAPPERDLWRLAQGGASVLRDYRDATATTPDPQLIELYALRWDLAEIASFAEEFRKPHQDTEDSRNGLAILQSIVRRLKTEG